MDVRGAGALLADGAPLTVPRDPARDQARRELLDPVYHRHDPGLVQRILSWISDRLDDLFGSVGQVGNGGSGWGVALGVVIVLVIVGALWWRYGAPRRQARSATALFEAAGPRTAADFRSAAAAHAAAGRWAEAVREQMRALIRRLEERTLLDARPGRTADEAATEAGRALPAHAGALLTAARTFDDIAFGEHAADQAAYQALVELDRALESARPEPIAGGAG